MHKSNMHMTALLLAALLAVSAAFPFGRASDGGQNWAVLVAGSYTWGNYRHQADVCHAYQVLISHGFDPDNIITFMYDDIANNIDNPDKGVIINRPNGPNVYEGVRKDYTKKDVTPANFLNVIKGNKTAMSGVGTGRVLESGPNDHVFINFVDHGGPGIIAFPDEMLQASDLNSALKYMNENNMYSELVFYLEACESGSMFQNILPSNTKVFATTAADATHSSYACYYDDKLHTYLGDVYSVNWMENSDAVDLSQETLHQQFEIVRNETNTSTVCQFGDRSFAKSPLIDFQGSTNSSRTASAGIRARVITNPNADAVDSRSVDLAILRHRLDAASTIEEKAMWMNKLQQEVDKRAAGKALFERIVARAAGQETVTRHMSTRLSLQDYSCVEQASVTFHKYCINMGKESWALEYTMAFVSMCADGVTTHTIKDAILQECPMYKILPFHI
eukprot:m.12312 g.12312  ORF g.12312 m.12312 type:complete len:448 (-) comp6831_c0_seq1:154-1497(-)